MSSWSIPSGPDSRLGPSQWVLSHRRVRPPYDTLPDTNPHSYRHGLALLLHTPAPHTTSLSETKSFRDGVTTDSPTHSRLPTRPGLQDSGRDVCPHLDVLGPGTGGRTERKGRTGPPQDRQDPGVSPDLGSITPCRLFRVRSPRWPRVILTP